MIRVRGNEDKYDSVLMPQECLQIFRQGKTSGEIEGHKYYWAIEHKSDGCRVAHLIENAQRKDYQRPGIRSIIPAYTRGADIPKPERKLAWTG